MPSTIGTVVDAALEAVAERRDVRVLDARDVGSRAWNLADEDSDVDVALLFVQDPVEYATLDGYAASLEFEVDVADLEIRARNNGERDDPSERAVDVETVDGRGWNVRRFAELVVDSNPTAFEFLHSPLRYRENAPLARLEADVGEAFAPPALYHHYRSLARRQYRKYLQGRLLEGGDLAYRVLEDRGDEYLVRHVDDDETAEGRADDDSGESRTVPKGEYVEATTDRTVKRHLYVVRGVLYAQYVRETHRFPALDFPRFLEEMADFEAFDDDLVGLARKLVERKRRGEGDTDVGRLLGPSDVELPPMDPSVHSGRRPDRDRVDDFVRDSLEAAFDWVDS